MRRRPGRSHKARVGDAVALHCISPWQLSSEESKKERE